MSQLLTESFQNFDALPDSAFVRIETVASLFSCSPVTVWRKSKDGTFPQPKKLSVRITGWNVGELRNCLKKITESEVIDHG